jgi:hypothetical protein
MNKKLITAISAVVLVLPITFITAEAKADTQAPAVAVLDTALDTSLPIFKDRIAYEVCILEWSSCPNGQKFMEGPGSTVLPSNIISQNGFDHGTAMASIVANTDPNIKIVFIRIIGNTKAGVRQSSGEITVMQALQWVSNNKDKFNIQAVAMSQGHHNLSSLLTEYCPKSTGVRLLINSLLQSGVPAFFPAGNGRDYDRLDWPACINDSISVGMTDQYDQIDNYSNYDSKRLDFYALGNLQVTYPGGIVKYGAGTSASVQVAAATWVAIKNKNPNFTYQQIFDTLNSTSLSVKGSRGQLGKMISYKEALNVR